MNYAIRALTSADEPVLWEMLYHAIHVLPGEPLPPREIVQQPELARYAARWGRPDDLGFLALMGSVQPRPGSCVYGSGCRGGSPSPAAPRHVRVCRNPSGARQPGRWQARAVVL